MGKDRVKITHGLPMSITNTDSVRPLPSDSESSPQPRITNTTLWRLPVGSRHVSCLEPLVIILPFLSSYFIVEHLEKNTYCSDMITSSTFSKKLYSNLFRLVHFELYITARTVCRGIRGPFFLRHSFSHFRTSLDYQSVGKRQELRAAHGSCLFGFGRDRVTVCHCGWWVFNVCGERIVCDW